MNSIQHLLVERVHLEGFVLIIEAVAKHFENHFNVFEVAPMIDIDCKFKKNSEPSVNMLENPFLMKNIWKAVADCEGRKPRDPTALIVTS